VTEEQADRLEQKLDALLSLKPVIDALGDILVRPATATQRLGTHRNTIPSNEKIEKFEEFGTTRTMIAIRDVSVIRRKRR